MTTRNDPDAAFDDTLVARTATTALDALDPARSLENPEP